MNDLNVFMATEVMEYCEIPVVETVGDMVIKEDGFCWQTEDDEYILVDEWHPTEDIAQSIICRDRFLIDNPTYQFSLYSYRNLENEIINHVYLEDGHGNIYESLLSKLSFGICSAITQAVEDK